MFQGASEVLENINIKIGDGSNSSGPLRSAANDDEKLKPSSIIIASTLLYPRSAGPRRHPARVHEEECPVRWKTVETMVKVVSSPDLTTCAGLRLLIKWLAVPSRLRVYGRSLFSSSRNL